jgi:hypothetical protein
MNVLFLENYLKTIGRIVLISALYCLNAMTSVYAQTAIADDNTINNSNIIFNWAEQHYFQFFPNHQSIFPSNTNTIIHSSGWVYRYYPVSDNYVGVLNNDVYIAGASFTAGALNPIKVFSVPEAIKRVAASTSHANSVNKSGSELPFTTIHENTSNFDFRFGGYGSAVSAHPSSSNQFYILTDRGPSVSFKGDEGKGTLFPFPDYSPRIGLFGLNSDGKVTWLKDIILKDLQSKAISGLPNSSELGGTGETPYDVFGNALKDSQGIIRRDDFGLDTEGLVALKDGTFWVSDEYGPHLVHFDSTGKEIDRINPFINDFRTRINLPAEFLNRAVNHGMEGLAITPDQTTLVGIMQSTLANPKNKVTDSKLTRIVTINLETGEIGQYLYKQDKKQNSNSDIVALSATQFLVIERDGGLLNGGSKKPSPNTQKLIFKIDLSTATNLETVPLSQNMTQDEVSGLTIKGDTLEEYILEKSWKDLAEKGITPVQKKLVVDMVAELAYPHDKVEGLWVIDAQTIGIVNDDDFAIWPTENGFENKYINATKTRIDTSTLYIIKGLNLNENIE